MSVRRYTDEEVEAILSRAAEGPQSSLRQLSGTEGLTLADLQEIGREVGIPAEAVALAARSVDQRPPAVSRTSLGLPIGVERTISLDRRLTEGEWERLVVELREVFHARGTVRSDGSFRQWTNGNLQALLESTAAGHRLRLSTRNGNARSWMTAGLAALGVSVATAISTAASGHFGNSVPGIVLLGLIGLGMFANGALRLPAWARQRGRQMDAITAGLAVRTGLPGSDPPPIPRD